MLAPVRAPGRIARTASLFEGVARNADLRRVLLGWASSNLASRASAIAIAVYAYQAGGASAVGVIAFVRLTAAAVVSPWLSILADRRPRKAVMLGGEIFRCAVLVAMAALVEVGAASAAVYVLAVVVAIAEPLFRSAQAALTPSLVSTPEELTAANVLASGVESVGLFLGPALGALVLAFTDVATVLAACAVLVALTIVVVARIGDAGRPEPEPRDKRRLHALLAGWHAILADRGLRVVIALFAAQALVAGMFNVLVVVLALEVLDLGTAGVGFLDGLVGVGAVLAVFVAAGLAGRRRLAGPFGFGLLLWGLPLVVTAGSSSVVATGLLLVLVGVGNTLVDVTGITLLQRTTPNAVLGRVFGAFEGLVVLAMGIGSLLAPLLVATLGARGALVVAGLVLPVFLVGLWRPLKAVDAGAEAPRVAVALLRGVPFFAALPAPELERLALALRDVDVAAGATVFRQGDRGDRFYVIRDGEAEIEVDGAHVRTLGAGDHLGEIALVRDVPRTATVRALHDLRLSALERDVFLATLARDPATAQAAGNIVAARLASPVIG
jgi:MFS family permease